jgi:hypothetical protein
MTIQQLIDELKTSGAFDYIWNIFVVNSELPYTSLMNSKVKRYDYDLNDSVPVLLIWIKK